MDWPRYERIDERPQLRESMVAFADLLGTSEHATADTAQATLESLDAALSKARRESNVDDMDDYFYTTWFSDNVALTAPLGADELEMQVGLMALSIAWLQFHLAIDGFFMRGGMQFGQQFSDASITFGPALVDAVKLEGATKFPRVALTEVAESVVGIVAVDHFVLDSNPFHYELAVDKEDGTTFISYLDAVMGELDEKDDPKEVIGLHRDAVLAQLDAHPYALEPEIWVKYEWVATYHNFVCSQWGLESMIIDSVPGRAFARYCPPDSKEDALENAVSLLEQL